MARCMGSLFPRLLAHRHQHHSNSSSSDRRVLVVKPTITCMAIQTFGIVLSDQTVSWVPGILRLLVNSLYRQIYALISLAGDAAIKLPSEQSGPRCKHHTTDTKLLTEFRSCIQYCRAMLHAETLLLPPNDSKKKSSSSTIQNSYGRTT